MTDETESMYSRLNQKALAKRQGLPEPELPKKPIPTTAFPLTEWISTVQLARLTGLTVDNIYNRMCGRKDVEKRRVRREVQYRWKPQGRR